MTESLTEYQQLEEALITNRANKIAQQVGEKITSDIKEFFPESYDNPFGQLPPEVQGAIEVITNEVWHGAKAQGKAKLQTKLREGMEALLNA